MNLFDSCFCPDYIEGNFYAYSREEVIDNDEGGISRDHCQGGPDFEGVRGKGVECFYEFCDEGFEEGWEVDFDGIWDFQCGEEEGEGRQKSSDRKGD